MAPVDPQPLRQRISDFVKYRNEFLTGDEKGEAQIFLDRMFRAFGHEGVVEAGATLEHRLKKHDDKGTSFADLLWPGRCLIEMKKSGSKLVQHYRQAFDYWVRAVPDRPRYVILCNFDEFLIYDFSVQLDEPMDRIPIEQLAQRWDGLSFLLPIEQRPSFGNDLVAVTREAAAQVASVFGMLRERNIDRIQAQRFVLQCVMTMFAQDISLLPGHSFSQAVEESLSGGSSYDLLFGLFREMNRPGYTPAGRYKGTPYFNGGLFADIQGFDLTRDELIRLHDACQTDWSAVRPEIFGTLFETGMDHGERHAYGAHFTSQADIALVVGPTIVDPWREKIERAGTILELEHLLGELSEFRILDPACGSGNFLYVAYREIRRLERDIHLRIAERRRSGAVNQGSISFIHTSNFYGIDKNEFAVEIAKVTMMLGKKLSSDELHDEQQVLPLENLDGSIVAADALFTPWPAADVVIGNPPYMGRRMMSDELGPAYCQDLAERYPGVKGVSDFVTYWFPLAHNHLKEGGRAGFVATNSVRDNQSRVASLDYVVDNGGYIFDAVSSKPWSGDAVVHVSIVNWSKGVDVNPKILWLNNGNLRLSTEYITSALTTSIDARKAATLDVNQAPATCFQGQTAGIVSAYLIDRGKRREILAGEDQSLKYIHPFLGGRELLHGASIDKWVIDVPENDFSELDAYHPRLAKYLKEKALIQRQKLLDKEEEKNRLGALSSAKFRPENQHRLFMNRWWQLWRRRSEMIDSISALPRYLATSRHMTENRNTVFSFVDSRIHPGDALTVFALADDFSFGIVSSSVHDAWLQARCSHIKSDPRYTSTTVWDSFPWPQSASNEDAVAVAEAAAEILKNRQKFSDRGISLAKQYDGLKIPGKNRTRDLHLQLDAAVLKAYGFSVDEDLVAQLLALNLDLNASSSAIRGPGGRHYTGVHLTDFRLIPPIT
ncbi:DNA methyltransferase [Streptacidiphilus sp. P02-A3a]|uniref:DNA methyltransferase n=1 Tax=Streptacidiphilus sp. P02-A3a TaxID=2704468 RepID=UPI0015FDB32D|nr:DNA methyltransferase [Streptacidiphilus sp. P02-A3a]QMU68113.1 class I SAM-dependent DNA methyltransferase [Streptacidiphilus sp. P02-A3a]